MIAPAGQLEAALARARREGWAHWVRGRIDHSALLAGCYFDQAAADRFAQFCERFIRIAPSHPTPEADAAGTIPMRLMPWQREVCGHIFGWRRADGSRRFRQAYIEVAKKNSKSTLAAAITLYLLIADGEPEPQLYSAATTRTQAGIIFQEAAKMVRKSPALQRLIDIKEHTKRLVVHRTSGFYQALSSDGDSADGVNASGIVIDEAHRLKGRSRQLWNTLQYAGAARRQPLTMTITTAGEDRDSIGWELHDRAAKIISGAIDDPYTFACIAAAPDGCDITDPAAWRAANPSLGVTIMEDEVRAEAMKAKDSPTLQNNFRRFRLNQWVGSISQWLPFDRWLECAADIDPADYEGRECWAGLDLSGTNDVTALVLVFPNVDGTRDVLPYFWIPADTVLDHEKKAGVPYRQWVQDGYLETTPGDYIDYDHIRRRIVELGQRYRITELAYDPKFAQQIASQLQGDGFTVFEFWQRRTMTNPVLRHLERLVLERRLRHGNHPILNWMASNVEVHEDADGLIKTVKPKDTRKIDGIDALSFALGNDIRAARDDEPTFYQDFPFAFV
jgi:phage terminase large subunit-like protein